VPHVKKNCRSLAGNSIKQVLFEMDYIDIFASFISGKREDYRYKARYITKKGSCRRLRMHANSIVDAKRNALGVTRQ